MQSLRTNRYLPRFDESLCKGELWRVLYSAPKTEDDGEGKLRYRARILRIPESNIRVTGCSLGQGLLRYWEGELQILLNRVAIETEHAR